MHTTKNIVIDGASGKPVALDIFYTDGPPKPVVIYVHGFNGFKDWGGFDAIAAQFANAGFCFIKFNFSHNGTTVEAPEDFVDLEAYGNNNYTKELFDVSRVIDWALTSNEHGHAIADGGVCLIGHSRGGGIVLLQGVEDIRVKAITTWASIIACKTPWGQWSDDRMQAWKKTGVEYYVNHRTKQNLPLYYQLFQDFETNQQRLAIVDRITTLKIPVLICHGTNDEAVPVSNAQILHDAIPGSELFLIPSDHVFGRKHPWPQLQPPPPMQMVVDKTIAFFQQHYISLT